jgi:acetyl-CoA C-acetyltransferase
MGYENAAIPIRSGWSSPFTRWQGPLGELSSIDLASGVTSHALARQGLPPSEIDGLVVGWTVPMPEIFYGAPTLAARIGAGHVSGVMLSQACATSAACVESATMRVETAMSAVCLVVTMDRTSNGPFLTWPRPSAPGGAPEHETWVLDAFAKDPWAGAAMTGTAELVAREEGIGREELDELTLLRHEQYQTALADDRAFQRRYMIPVEIPRRRRDPEVISEDHGVFPTTAEGLAKLGPVEPGGVVTYGNQTHPADGAAGMIVTTVERARQQSNGGGIARILGTGAARVGRSQMPKAPVPAAEAALRQAGLSFSDVDATTMHDPFAVNDVYFSRQTGIPPEKINERGASLIFGHPQGPTGARLLVELMHVLHERGGGVGLFTGCAAGDSGAAVVIRVED